MNILHLKTTQHAVDFDDYLLKTEKTIHHLVASDERDIQNVEVQGVSLIHAHDWLTAGRWALSLNEQFGIPFVITISPDDCLELASWRFKSRNYAILEAASKILMPSPAIQNRMADGLPKKVADRVFSKMVPLGYGISPFWLEHLNTPEPVSIIHTRLLFTGLPDKDAHLDTLLKAVELLRQRNFDVTLSIAQLPDSQDSVFEVKKMFSRPFVHFLKIQSEEELLQCYRAHDMLVMPCDSGVPVRNYVQALSQGLPLIYSADGFFVGVFQEGSAGYAVHPGKVKDLADKILMITQQYGTIGQHIADLHPLNSFNWNELWPKYNSLYYKCITHNL